jgi:4a-hydroxytetrahydrobiopterin dehydratase
MADEKPRVYAEADIPAKLAEHGLTGWYLEDGWLRRKFVTEGWPVTLMLVNAIGYLAEAAYHHPDLAVTWGKVWVKLKTHSAGGITDKDFALAKKIEEVALWKPPADSPFAGGNPGKWVRPG